MPKEVELEPAPQTKKLFTFEYDPAKHSDITHYVDLNELTVVELGRLIYGQHHKSLDTGFRFITNRIHSYDGDVYTWNPFQIAVSLAVLEKNSESESIQKLLEANKQAGNYRFPLTEQLENLLGSLEDEAKPLLDKKKPIADWFTSSI